MFYGVDAVLIGIQMLEGGVLAGVCGIVVTITACAVMALKPFVRVRHRHMKIA